MVYTDTRLHVGRVVCSLNTTWNVLPPSLVQRSCTELGDSCSFTFNSIGGKSAWKGEGWSTTGGQWDSTTSKLVELLFHDLPTDRLEAVLLSSDDEHSVHHFEHMVCKMKRLRKEQVYMAAVSELRTL